MFNPLATLTEEVLNAFIESGKRYFVRQTFNRAKDHFDEGIRGYYLFCHYDDYFQAKEHYDAIVNDANRHLYDWENEEDQKKLKIAASKPPGFKLYANVFRPDWEKLITDRIRQKVRIYVQNLGWKLPRGEGITPQFYPHFGEVYVRLSHKGREVRVKFEDIEKIH